MFYAGQVMHLLSCAVSVLVSVPVCGHDMFVSSQNDLLMCPLVLSCVHDVPCVHLHAFDMLLLASRMPAPPLLSLHVNSYSAFKVPLRCFTPREVFPAENDLSSDIMHLFSFVSHTVSVAIAQFPPHSTAPPETTVKDSAWLWAPDTFLTNAGGRSDLGHGPDLDCDLHHRCCPQHPAQDAMHK